MSSGRRTVRSAVKPPCDCDWLAGAGESADAAVGVLGGMRSGTRATTELRGGNCDAGEVEGDDAGTASSSEATAAAEGEALGDDDGMETASGDRDRATYVRRLSFTRVAYPLDECIREACEGCVESSVAIIPRH
jgi:hypothetical protein